MSRGPGRIEREIERIFATRPSETFTVDELAVLVYPGLNQVEKKHRVSLLRAADKVAHRLWWQGRVAESPGGQIVYRNLCNVISYTVGLRRTSYPAVCAEKALRQVTDPAARDSEWQQVQPGGAFWTHVEINKAERDGRQADADAMSAALNAKYDPMLKRMSPAAV